MAKGPLKVVLFTRGSSGRSRSIGKEDLLIKALRQRGVDVVRCCDFTKVSLEQQLYYSLNADILLGMHGGAIAHGVFMKPGLSLCF
jgi:hypothetical protein